MNRAAPLLWPLLVGLVSLAATAWLVHHERETEEVRLRASFEFGRKQAATRIEQRIASYTQMLRGVQGFMAANGAADPARFATYVDSLQRGTDLAGLRAIAYAPLLRRDAVAAHVQAQRDAGNGAYTVRPPGERATYAPLTFVAPATGSYLDALGIDPLADPKRQAAMLRARDSGEPAVTERLQLMLDGVAPPRPAFIMFLPLYNSGGDLNSVRARQAHLRGWVWAVFRVDDLIASLYGDELPGLSLTLYDGVAQTPDHRLYDTGAAPSDTTPRFSALEYLALPGHTWTLRVATQEGFDELHGVGAAGMIAAAGGVFSVLLALLTWQLVTARARAHAAAQAMTRELVDSEARYRRIVDTSQEGICLLDGGGRIVFANPMMLRLLGYGRGPADGAAVPTGRPLADFAGDANEAARLQALRRLDLTRPRQHEMRLRRRDGSDLWVSMSVNPSMAADGSDAGALCMVSDITERKAAETRRELLEVQLRESQKMEAIGTLAGGIAHDFNNILAVILGNVASARQEAASSASPLASLRQIDRAAVRARSLVQQILAFSRMQPQVLVSQPLKPLVEEAVALLRSMLPAQVDLEVRLTEATLYAGVDATQVQQVLMNLCTNAWHALPGGRGHIEIALERVELWPGQAQALGGIAPGGCAHLCVSDDGSGMDEATRARVFEPFFTTKRVGQGTGLGLSVVHGIVTAHHGAVSVESTPGHGSRFHVYLPLRDAPVEAPAVADEAPVDPAPGRGEHVLYIDDDPAMLLMVEALLQRAGFTVTAIGNPREALTAIAEAPDRYDVIVSDYNMPELTGLDVAEAVSRLARPVPLVITSGYIADDLRAAARAAGVHALLQKEYTLEQLVGLVQAALASRRAPTHAG